MDIIKIHLYTVTAALPSVMVCHTSHIHSIVLYIVECKCTVNVSVHIVVIFHLVCMLYVSVIILYVLD